MLILCAIIWLTCYLIKKYICKAYQISLAILIIASEIIIFILLY